MKLRPVRVLSRHVYAKVGMTQLHAVAEAEVAKVEVAADRSYARYERTDASLSIAKDAVPLDLCRAAKKRFSRFGEAQLDCVGRGNVFTALKIAMILRQWHVPLSGRLNGELAVRPEMLVNVSTSDEGVAIMRLHVAPVGLPGVPSDVLLAPASDRRIGALAGAILAKAPGRSFSTIFLFLAVVSELSKFCS